MNSIRMVKEGDILIDTNGSVMNQIRVTSIGTRKIVGLCDGHEYEMTWDYAEKHALHQDDGFNIENPYKKIEIQVVTNQARPMQYAEVLFRRDPLVIAHVTKNDGTLDKAYERAMLRKTPESEWYAAALKTASVLCSLG